MAKWKRYLIGRSWTMRAGFLALAIVLGLAAALWIYPYLVDRTLLAELASGNEVIRQKAMLRAEKAALTRPRTLQRLNDALEGADDDLFLTLGVVLRNAGKFRTHARPAEMYDRLRAIELTRSSQVDVREILTMEAVAARRNNRYQKQALDAAANDSEPAVRSLAATLAAMLGDDATLEKLLGDKDAGVAAGAAIDAGVAGRVKLVEPLRKALRSGQPQVRGSAAWALGRLSPKEHAAEILSSAGSIPGGPELDGVARYEDYVLHAATLLGDAQAKDYVLKQTTMDPFVGLTASQPSAMSLLAAGKLRIAEAGPAVKAVLRAAGRTDEKTTLYEEQVLAAIEAAAQLKLDVRAELNGICQRLWGPDWPLVLIAASRELGRQMEVYGPTLPTASAATQPATSPATQPADEFTPLQTLRLAAVYHVRPPTTRPDQVAPAVIATPVPSAAAAVALWLVEQSSRRGVLAASGPATGPATVPRSPQGNTARPPQDESITDMYVRNAAAEATSLPGEYIAWHLGTSDLAGGVRAGPGDAAVAAGPARTAGVQRQRAVGWGDAAGAVGADERAEVAGDRADHRAAWRQPDRRRGGQLLRGRVVSLRLGGPGAGGGPGGGLGADGGGGLPPAPGPDGPAGGWAEGGPGLDVVELADPG